MCFFFPGWCLPFSFWFAPLSFSSERRRRRRRRDIDKEEEKEEEEEEEEEQNPSKNSSCGSRRSPRAQKVDRAKRMLSRDR